MGKHSESEVLVLSAQLSLQIAYEDSEAILVLLLLLVLELAVAEGLLDAVPEGAKGAAVLLQFHGWELPGEIDTVEIVILHQAVHRLDELVAGVSCLSLEVKGKVF